MAIATCREGWGRCSVGEMIVFLDTFEEMTARITQMSNFNFGNLMNIG